MDGTHLGSPLHDLAPLSRDACSVAQKALDELNARIARTDSAIARSEAWDLKHAETLCAIDDGDDVARLVAIDPSVGQRLLIIIPSSPDVDGDTLPDLWWSGPEFECLLHALKRYGQTGEVNVLGDLLNRAGRGGKDCAGTYNDQRRALVDLLSLLDSWLEGIEKQPEPRATKKRARGRPTVYDPKSERRIADGYRSSGCPTYEAYAAQIGRSAEEVKSAVDRDRHARKN